MADLESFVSSVVERIEADVVLYEEPSLELKAKWPDGSENHQQWEIADLVATLANDAHLDGLRAVVYGPDEELARPAWLTDEARLRPKLLSRFDTGVIPRLELIRRTLDDGRQVDLLVIVDRSEAPYVTRFPEGHEWAVRVRTNTARRTATRAELLALTGSRRSPSAVRRLDLRLSRHKSLVTLTVTNAGTVRCREVKAHLPEEVGVTWIDGDGYVYQLADLGPGHKDGCKFFAGGWDRSGTRFEIKVVAIAEDDEPVTADILYSSDLIS